MKFTNGYWLIKEGVDPHFAACVYEAEQQGDELVIYAPERPINARGSTLNCLLLTIRYSSPMENVIKVRVSHFDGGVNRGPHFPLEQYDGAAFKPSVCVTEENAVLESGDLSVIVEKGPKWSNSFRGKGKVLTRNQSRSTAYIVDRNDGVFVKEELSLSVGELVYGLGEHFGPLVKNGQTVDIWNADGGTASEQAYKNIPCKRRGSGILHYLRAGAQGDSGTLHRLDRETSPAAGMELRSLALHFLYHFLRRKNRDEFYRRHGEAEDSAFCFSL